MTIKSSSYSNRRSPITRLSKRGLDLIIAATALILFSPVMLIIASAIWMEDRGSVFYRQERVGQNGVPIRIMKFRSMPVDTAAVPSALSGGLRITRVGSVIRRFSLDELPQLLTVLRGDMSVVGPRPALESQVELITLRRQLGALACKPGLTGLAQVNSYTGMSEVEKARWDADYARRYSARLDVAILLRTIPYFLKPPPTY